MMSSLQFQCALQYPLLFTVQHGCQLKGCCCRFGLGRFTTAAEVDRAVELTVRHVNKLREMSPLWELVQEGVDLKTIQWSQH